MPRTGVVVPTTGQKHVTKRKPSVKAVAVTTFAFVEPKFKWDSGRTFSIGYEPALSLPPSRLSAATIASDDLKLLLPWKACSHMFELLMIISTSGVGPSGVCSFLSVAASSGPFTLRPGSLGVRT